MIYHFTYARPLGDEVQILPLFSLGCDVLLWLCELVFELVEYVGRDFFFFEEERGVAERFIEDGLHPLLKRWG
jgi:hypothetical protein